MCEEQEGGGGSGGVGCEERRKGVCTGQVHGRKAPGAKDGWMRECVHAAATGGAWLFACWL